MPEGSPEDFEGAAAHKEKAAEAKASGNHAEAVTHLTAALLCQPTAMTFAARAESLLALKRPNAAVSESLDFTYSK